VELVVVVEDDHDRSARGRERAVASRRCPGVRLGEEADPVAVATDDAGCPVQRAVVDDDQLDVVVTGLLENGLDGMPDEPLSVEGGEEDREAWRGRDSRTSDQPILTEAVATTLSPAESTQV
jgi:hypothetical protein